MGVTARESRVHVAADLVDESGGAIVAAVVVPALVACVGERGRGHAEQHDDHEAEEDGRPLRPRASPRVER
jgi:hypothetical protein